MSKIKIGIKNWEYHIEFWKMRFWRVNQNIWERPHHSGSANSTIRIEHEVTGEGSWNFERGKWKFEEEIRVRRREEQGKREKEGRENEEEDGTAQEYWQNSLNHKEAERVYPKHGSRIRQTYPSIIPVIFIHPLIKTYRTHLFI